MLGGLVAGIGALLLGSAAIKICDYFKAPIWVTKILFSSMTLVLAFITMKIIVPYNDFYRNALGALVISSGILIVGWQYLNEKKKKN